MRRSIPTTIPVGSPSIGIERSRSSEKLDSDEVVSMVIFKWGATMGFNEEEGWICSVAVISGNIFFVCKEHVEDA